MRVRQRFRDWMLRGESGGDDLPPRGALIEALFGRDEERLPPLGEYDATSYPLSLRELLARREEVTRELLDLGITERAARLDSVPRLRELLVLYPHPLIYETLIHAYLDADRFDEARGVAFAARQRRLECARSPHPEVRSEIEFLKEWEVEEIDLIQRERLRRP